MDYIEYLGASVSILTELYILGVGEYITAWIQYGSDYILKCVSMGEATLFMQKTIVGFEISL